MRVERENISAPVADLPERGITRERLNFVTHFRNSYKFTRATWRRIIAYGPHWITIAFIARRIIKFAFDLSARLWR